MAVSSTHTGWRRDIANSRLEFYYRGTKVGHLTASGIFIVSAMTFAPITSDGAGLGSASLMWADLFLASGSVINFNNGDITLTHSTNTLTFGGGTFTFGTSDSLIMPVKASSGTTSGDFWIDTTDGNLHMYYAGGEYYYSKVAV